MKKYKDIHIGIFLTKKLFNLISVERVKDTEEYPIPGARRLLKFGICSSNGALFLFKTPKDIGFFFF